MRKLKTALLISGGGTTAEAVIKASLQGTLTGIDPIVIASSPEIMGVKRIKSLGLKPEIIDRNSFANIEIFGEKLLRLLKQRDVQLISLQGWLPLIISSIVKTYRGMIINQHPGPLDPGRVDFGGKGMSNPYRVTCARIAYTWMSGDDPYTESVVHFVEEEFDKGDLIRIIKMPLTAKSKKIKIGMLEKEPEELVRITHESVKRFYPIEHANVIDALQLFADGMAKGFSRKMPLVPKENIGYVTNAKKLAIQLFPYLNL